eukprot:INCI5955.4.p1 GENE.INCI5955.4~~INCI5955.4.p1  ORF type:complete len:1347 (-),score=254.95 INCI5955.4:574-4614(-)
MVKPALRDAPKRYQLLKSLDASDEEFCAASKRLVRIAGPLVRHARSVLEEFGMEEVGPDDDEFSLNAPCTPSTSTVDDETLISVQAQDEFATESIGVDSNQPHDSQRRQQQLLAAEAAAVVGEKTAVSDSPLQGSQESVVSENSMQDEATVNDDEQEVLTEHQSDSAGTTVSTNDEANVAGADAGGDGGDGAEGGDGALNRPVDESDPGRLSSSPRTENPDTEKPRRMTRPAESAEEMARFKQPLARSVPGVMRPRRSDWKAREECAAGDGSDEVDPDRYESHPEGWRSRAESKFQSQDNDLDQELHETASPDDSRDDTVAGAAARNAERSDAERADPNLAESIAHDGPVWYDPAVFDELLMRFGVQGSSSPLSTVDAAEQATHDPDSWHRTPTVAPNHLMSFVWQHAVVPLIDLAVNAAHSQWANRQQLNILNQWPPTTMRDNTPEGSKASSAPPAPDWDDSSNDGEKPDRASKRSNRTDVATLKMNAENALELLRSLSTVRAAGHDHLLRRAFTASPRHNFTGKAASKNRVEPTISNANSFEESPQQADSRHVLAAGDAELNGSNSDEEDQQGRELRDHEVHAFEVDCGDKLYDTTGQSALDTDLYFRWRSPEIQALEQMRDNHHLMAARGMTSPSQLSVSPSTRDEESLPMGLFNPGRLEQARTYTANNSRSVDHEAKTSEPRHSDLDVGVAGVGEITTLLPGAGGSFTLPDAQVRQVACAGQWIFALTDNGSLYSGSASAVSDRSGTLPSARMVGGQRHDDPRAGALCWTIVRMPARERVKFVTCAAMLSTSDSMSVRSTSPGDVGSSTSNGSQTSPSESPSATVRRDSRGHVLVLTEAPTGNLWAWGDNAFGQLGLGECTDCVETPERVDFFRTPSARHSALVGATGKHVAHVAVAPGVSIAVTALNEVFGWGSNHHSQLLSPAQSGEPRTVVLEPTLLLKGQHFNSHNMSRQVTGASASTVNVHSEGGNGEDTARRLMAVIGHDHAMVWLASRATTRSVHLEGICARCQHYASDVRKLHRRLLRSLHWSNELEARLATLQAKFVQLQAKSIQEMRANLHDSTRVSRRTPSEGFIAHGASLLRAVLQYQKDEVQLRLKHNTMTASVRQLAASVRSNEIQQHRQSARILMLQKRIQAAVNASRRDSSPGNPARSVVHLQSALHTQQQQFSDQTRRWMAEQEMLDRLAERRKAIKAKLEQTRVLLDSVVFARTALRLYSGACDELRAPMQPWRVASTFFNRLNEMELFPSGRNVNRDVLHRFSAIEAELYLMVDQITDSFEVEEDALFFNECQVFMGILLQNCTLRINALRAYHRDIAGQTDKLVLSDNADSSVPDAGVSSAP